MRALFVYSNKYERCDGVYYSMTQTADVWEKRYLNVFSELLVVGRVIDVEKTEGKKASNTTGVEFHCTNLGVNPFDYITKQKEIKAFIAALVSKVDFVIARQSFFGAIAAQCARRQKKPYVVEVVGSSWDANWNYSIKGKLAAPFFELQAKRMVKNAKNVIYVTQHYLQKEYPTKGKTSAISNVEIEKASESVLRKRRDKINALKPMCFSLCTVAAVDVKYKGQQYVLAAMRRLRKKGFHLSYYIVGGGNQERLRKKAQAYDILDSVVFTGPLTKDAVIECLDSIDIYIQPSLQEGLPRAMIEAMSRGAFAIGFNTAGIPELIDKEYVCKRKSVSKIVKIIESLSKEQLLLEAERNIEESKQYSFDILNKRRERFLKMAVENHEEKNDFR